MNRRNTLRNKSCGLQNKLYRFRTKYNGLRITSCELRNKFTRLRKSPMEFEKSDIYLELCHIHWK